MKTNNAKKVLELGAGHGIDTIFFGSNGIEVKALDYSVIACEILDNRANEKSLTRTPQIFDVNSLPRFSYRYFDAGYSHMLLNMHFSPVLFARSKACILNAFGSTMKKYNNYINWEKQNT
jgi:ubiquinone/menaquinone biosynthesis C-methylase UbiE